MKKLISIFLVSVLALTAFAQKISVSELAKIKDKSNVVLVDARGASDYKKTHIKGAVNLDVEKLCNNSPIEGILKSPSQLASIFGKHGISEDKTIVIYCKTGVRAGRMYWILKYLGANDVRMLNGQLNAWFKARKPITKSPTKPKAVAFSPSVNSKLKVDKSYVSSKMNSGSVVLVDTRKAEDFNAGHIGNAVNIPHKQFLSGKKCKSNSSLSSILKGKGVTKNKEVILYCKTSTTAGLAYFIMASLLNYPDVKLYDGAYLEWSK